MKIMIKINEKEKWQKVDEKGYINEKELQEILADSPDLIPVGELGGGRKPIKVAVREAGLPGSGSTDLIGVDEDGGITIVETKLAQNAEIKRKVIGQILEYGAYLWQKPFKEFDDIFYRKLGGHLVDLMEKVEKENEEWSVDGFRNAVEANLKNGTFALFIVVDEINEELRRIIDYLKFKNFTNFEFYALELKYFHEKEKGASIILPQLYGVANRPSSGKREYGVWNKESFFQDAQSRIQDKSSLAVLSDLYKFSEENADMVGWGNGTDRGTFTFKIVSKPEENKASVFTVWSDGFVSFRFGNIQRNISQKAAEELYEKFRGSSGMESKEYMFSDKGFALKIPVIEIFPDEKALVKFEKAVLDFKKEIQRTLSN